MKNRKKIWIGILIAAISFVAVVGGVSYYRVTKSNDTANEIESVRLEEVRATGSSSSRSGVADAAGTSMEEIATVSKLSEGISSHSNNKEEATPVAYKGYVAIDPGHQGPDVDMSGQEPVAPGSSETKRKATGGTMGRFSGVAEYQLNLDVALKLSDELQSRGYKTILTRTDNETAISNSERAILANESGADFLIRIHANGSEDSTVNGACALIPGLDNPWCGDQSAKSRELASDILSSYCSETGMASQGITTTNTMTGINWSTIPVCILEMGYMTNQTDDLNLEDAVFREKMVSGIADGIETYYRDYPTAWHETNENASSVTAENGSTAASQTTHSSAALQALRDQVRSSYLESRMSAGESWSVAWIDLSDQSEADINGDTQMLAASDMKLYIMAAIYDRVCDPQDPSKAVSFDESTYGSLSDLLTAMITVSDNDAANSLVEGLGQGNFSEGMQVVNKYCKDHGYSGTHMGRRFLDSTAEDDNYTTAADTARLMASIYGGTCVSKKASSYMMDLLKAQTRTSKIPAGVKAYGVSTANKTGELNGAGLGTAENDAAIVFGEPKPYVLCVFSSNIESNSSAISTIIQISSDSYRAIENK